MPRCCEFSSVSRSLLVLDQYLSTNPPHNVPVKLSGLVRSGPSVVLLRDAVWLQASWSLLFVMHSNAPEVGLKSEALLVVASVHNQP